MIKMSLFVFIFCFFAQKGQPSSFFEEAQSSFDKGDFQNALTLLLEHPHLSSAYYYNIGFIHTKLQHFALAKGYFLKALMLDPHNERAQAHLADIQSMDPSAAPVSLFYRMLKRLHTYEADALLFFLILISALLWMRAYAKGPPTFLDCIQSRKGMISFLPLSVAFLIGTTRSPLLFPTQLMCVESASLTSGPSHQFLKMAECKSADMLKSLHRTLVQENQAWLQVQTMDQTIGWIEKNKILEF